MAETPDPRNPVITVFLRAAGINPAKAEQPSEPTPIWKPPAPNVADQFVNPKRGIEHWFR